MKRLLSLRSLIVLASLILLSIGSSVLFRFVPALAAGQAAPAATGSVGYTAYGLQRYADFNAHQTSPACLLGWNVVGNWKIAHHYLGSDYVHDMIITSQDSHGNLQGHGGYPAGGPYTYAWTIDSGNVTGNKVTITAHYTSGVPPTTILNMAATIAPDGTLSGTWSDNLSGGRSGPLTTVSGSATPTLTGCTGQGRFHYTDVNGDWYYVDVQYVKVDGNSTWFAGPVTSGNVGAGSWLYAKVQDNGTPGSNGDQIWGSFTTDVVAKAGVALMTAPVDGPFKVSSGNLVVHN